MWTRLMTTTVQIAVVGGGPAGLAAAGEAARAGLTVHLYDERPALGGPVYGRAAESTLLAELHAAGPRIVRHQGATVWGIFESRTLAVWENDRADCVRPEVIVLASGAHDRPMPIPGWTLPGVTNAETMHALVETRALPRGWRVLVAGTGPVLPVVAGRLVRAGAEVVAVLDAASSERMPQALPSPWGEWALSGDAAADGNILRAARIPFVGSRTVARVVGDETVRAAVTVAVDEAWRPIQGSEERVEVAAVCFVWGSVPSTQLSQLCGAEHRYAVERGGWVPARSAEMETTVPRVFSTGDGAGIGGAAVAVLEGRMAGIAAAARLGAISPEVARSRGEPLQTALAPLRKSQALVGRLTATRAGLAELITPDTVICPCEAITGAQVDQALNEGAGDLGQIKRMTRAGMGQCQGRMCNPALTTMLAHRRGIPREAMAPPSIRPPVTPIPIHVLATLRDE
jgi:thioredoxin reductase/bacterioferritin-associated ferredoxin